MSTFPFDPFIEPYNVQLLRAGMDQGEMVKKNYSKFTKVPRLEPNDQIF